MNLPQRLVMLVGAMFLIYGGIYTDIAGLAIGTVLFIMQRKQHGGKAGNGKHCVNRYVTRAKLCTSRNREVPAFFRTFRTTIKKPACIKDAGRYHHQATALAQIIHHLQHWGRLIQRVEVQAWRAAVQQAFTQASHYIGTKGGNGVAVIAVGF